MWKSIYKSEPGTSHLVSRQPCQDFGAAVSVRTAEGVVLLAACADGAGSAEHSEIGSKLAVEHFLNHTQAYFDQGGSLGDYEDLSLRYRMVSARAAIYEEATTLGVAPRSLACTILAAVVGENFAIFSQIGDGVIVYDEGDSYSSVMWPDSGEYANTTRFLTDTNALDYLRTVRIDRRIDDLALMTDGLQMLALNFADRSVHAPFFQPLFKVLKASETIDGLVPKLGEFLNSDRVNSRTDDDKTLILATRERVSVDGSPTDSASPTV